MQQRKTRLLLKLPRKRLKMLLLMFKMQIKTLPKPPLQRKQLTRQKKPQGLKRKQRKKLQMTPQKQPPKLSLMRLRESRPSNLQKRMLWLQRRLNKMPPKRQPMRPPQRQLLMLQLQRKQLMLQLHKLLRIRQHRMPRQQR